MRGLVAYAPTAAPDAAAWSGRLPMAATPSVWAEPYRSTWRVSAQRLGGPGCHETRVSRDPRVS
jgi:hypothetical protein